MTLVVCSLVGCDVFDESLYFLFVCLEHVCECVRVVSCGVSCVYFEQLVELCLCECSVCVCVCVCLICVVFGLCEVCVCDDCFV